MGRLDSRLERLERRAGTSPLERERSINCEVLRRMSDEDLDRYEEALERLEGGGAFEAGDLPFLRKVEELVEEVRVESA